MKYLDIVEAELPPILDAIRKEIEADPMLQEFVRSRDFEAQMERQKEMLLRFFLEYGRRGELDEHYCWRFYKDFDLPFIVVYKSLNTLKVEILKTLLEKIDDKSELIDISRFVNDLLNMVSKVYIRKETGTLQSLYNERFASYLLFRAHIPWVQRVIEAIRKDEMGLFPLESADRCRFSEYLNYPESLMVCLDMNLCNHLHDMHAMLHRTANTFYLFYLQEEYYQAYMAFQELIKNITSFNKTMVELYFLTYNNLEESFFNLVELMLYQKSDIYLTLIDIRGLKNLNNRYGEITVNKALAQLDQRMQALVHDREKEVLLIRGVTADYYLLTVDGGEEGHTQLLDALYEEANRTYEADGKSLAIASTFATLNLKGFYDSNRDDLIRMMLYLKDEAKPLAKSYRVESEEERQRLAAWLRDSYRDNRFIERKLSEGAIEVIFQPIYGLQSGRIEVLEALARIRDGKRLVPAGIFIDRVIAMGRIEQLDEMVLTRLMEQKEKIRQVADTLFVNINFKSLFSPSFMACFQRFVEVFHGHDVVFELTEQNLVENLDAVREVAERYAIRFAVDDFGSGYSSLKTVADLSRIGVLKVLKMDGSLVQEVDRDLQSRKIVKVIADLSETMGLLSVAEFVESEATLTLLKSLGISYAQGFHLSRPKPIEELLVERLNREGGLKTVPV